MPLPSATITIEWGYETHSIVLTPKKWARIVMGQPLSLRGKGYRCEGGFFWDYWKFGGGRSGSLAVEYGQEGGVAFHGELSDSMIEEHPYSPRHRSEPG